MSISLNTYVEEVGELGYVWPDKTSIYSLFDSVPDYAKQWRKLLAHAHGRHTLKIGFDIFGRRLKLSMLDYIEQNAEALSQRIKESRALAPLLGPIVLNKAKVPADYSVYKTGAMNRGLTPQAWRWLSRQQPATVRQLLELGWTEEAIFWCNCCARAATPGQISSRWFEPGRPYAMQQFWTLMSAWTEAARQKAMDQLTRYFRLLPQASGEELMNHEFVTVELYRAFQQQHLELLKPEQSWRGLQRKVRELQKQRLERATAIAAESLGDVQHLEWPPVLKDVTTLRGVQVAELCNSMALVKEGIDQDHCVGDGLYATLCARKESAIFCLTHQETRARATLQLRCNSYGNRWSVGQLVSQGNSRAPAIFWEVAKDLSNQLAA